MSDPSPETVAANLAIVRARIVAAALRAQRKPEDVTLIAVTKGVPVAAIKVLLQLGVKELGENRLQPAQPKIEALARETAECGVRWHMIGHLQTNKAREVLRRFDRVDAVDSVKLLEILAREAGKLGLPPVPALAEVNVSGEAQKYGLAPASLEGFLRRASELREIEVRGLMTMAPYADAPEQVEAISRPVFRGLRELLARANDGGWYREPLRELSMGMSADFEIAIEEGATQVRVGSSLFE